ncbi:hypothetical protein Q9L58_005903 [Maublancomyces gigas]|uniref:Uncharacterized protein n=1 Tax=Discina gigas TaxID=1032678 RepID=A0ABR3GH42_9PEZI
MAFPTDRQAILSPSTSSLPYGLAPSAELIVAMMSATRGRQPREGEHKFFNKSGGSVSRVPGTGISSHLTTSDRFHRILDGLASLCISRTPNQVLAVGFQINQPASRLTISIADNCDVEQDTVNFLEMTWDLLKELSNLYAEQRLKTGLPPTGVPCNRNVGVSPHIPRSREAAAIIERLTEHVYTFTWNKQMARINKWWDPTDKPGLLYFARLFQAKMGNQLTGNNRKLEIFLLLIRDTVTCLRSPKVDWELDIIFMKKAIDIASDLLGGDDPYWCSRLAISLMPPMSSPDAIKESAFPLGRAIERLTSHHRYLYELISFAHSPRLRLAFELKMTVDPVPVRTPPGTSQLPTSTEDWRGVLEDLCVHHDHILRPEQAVPILESLMRYCPKTPTPRRVHCECTLVAHYDHLRSTDGYVPPFSYIGVSKPSCKPCSLWLAAFNARGNGYPKFYTRGTHGKWYYPWTAPHVARWDPGIGHLLGSQFVEYLTAEGIAKSAVASEETAWEEDEVEDEKVMAYVDRSAKADF